MPLKILEHIDLDIFKVCSVFFLSVLINIGSSMIQLVWLKELLGIGALILSCAYTIWKWRKDIKKSKKNIKDE